MRSKLVAVLLPVLLLVTALLVFSPQMTEAQEGLSNFTSVGIAQDLTVGDDTTVGDNLSANDLTVADFVNVTAQSVLTLTMNGWLTPTGSLQSVASAGAVSINGGTRIAHTTDYLVLVNIGAQTITISETTGLISAGNIALGAGDSATLVWANGGWYQVAASNN